MSNRKHIAISVATAMVLLFCSTIAFAENGWRYLQSNVHAFQNDRDIKASYAVWTDPGVGHLVIPVNTQVKMKKWRRGFILLTKDGKNIYYDVDKRRTKMTGEEYFTNVLTKNKETDLSSFSKLDKKGIKEGKVQLGMSRKAVRIAYGYPSPHATPDIKGSIWTFWRNKFGRTQLTFDKKNKVVGIR